MPSATANSIQIEYDTFGGQSSPPLLLIMGLGAQMIMWDDALCHLIASRGFYVIRFDNRDVGLSSKFDKASEVHNMEILTAIERGEEPNVQYTLDDMADDAIGLLDALKVEKAHIFGVSLGGMIAQTIALRHPSRVLSLISMASTTGDPSLPPGKPQAVAALMAPPPDERNACIDHNANIFSMISGSRYPLDGEVARRVFERSFDRCHYPQGMVRQAAAVIMSGDRTHALRALAVPTLVIHGSEDPLFPIEHGRATAGAVPGGELFIIEGMGHAFGAAVWPLLVDSIVHHMNKAVS